MKPTTKDRIKKAATELLADVLVILGEKIANVAKESKEGKLTTKNNEQ